MRQINTINLGIGDFWHCRFKLQIYSRSMKMTEAEKMAKGYLWNDTKEYLAEQARAKQLVYEFNQSAPAEVEKRSELMQQIFGTCGKNVWINQPLTLCRGTTISIGNECYFNSGTTFVDDYKITIGNRVMFGPNVTVCTTGHPLDPEHRFDGMYSLPVVIEDGVWIGANAVILPGVTIGENSVIGAGSVVTKDIPANVLAVRSPCMVLREFSDYDKEYYHKGLRFDAQEID